MEPTSTTAGGARKWLATSEPSARESLHGKWKGTSIEALGGIARDALIPHRTVKLVFTTRKTGRSGREAHTAQLGGGLGASHGHLKVRALREPGEWRDRPAAPGLMFYLRQPRGIRHATSQRAWITRIRNGHMYSRTQLFPNWEFRKKATGMVTPHATSLINATAPTAIADASHASSPPRSGASDTAARGNTGGLFSCISWMRSPGADTNGFSFPRYRHSHPAYLRLCSRPSQDRPRPQTQLDNLRKTLQEPPVRGSACALPIWHHHHPYSSLCSGPSDSSAHLPEGPPA